MKISAANNLTIDIDNNVWRLYNDRTESTLPVVEARSDGILYLPAFASARRLSPDGRLAERDISMVVVGWAAEDASWHLGLIVGNEIAQARGGRWCGLARWEDQDGDRAEQAGVALSQTLNKPFRYVPPVDRPRATAVIEPPLPDEAQGETVPSSPAAVSAPAPARAPALPEVRPMRLPIDLGEWVFQEHPQGFSYQRSKAWRTKTLIYGLMGLILALIFCSLSLGARLTAFALVQPDWLPIVGLGIGLVMLAVGMGQLLKLVRATTAIIDTHQQIVRVVRGNRTLLQSPYEGLEYLLVSHIAGRREPENALWDKQKRKIGPDGSPVAPDLNMAIYDRFWPEVWIHLYSPRRGFIELCYATMEEGRIQAGISFKGQRRALDLTEIDTSGHQAALLTAQAIGIPAYVEER